MANISKESTSSVEQVHGIVDRLGGLRIEKSCKDEKQASGMEKKGDDANASRLASDEGYKTDVGKARAGDDYSFGYTAKIPTQPTRST